jgi:rhodanese-related sulfurtransferase
LRAQAAGALLIDTRCAELRRETGVIPGSVHLPLSVLYWRLDPTSDSADPQLAEPDREVILV